MMCSLDVAEESKPKQSKVKLGEGRSLYANELQMQKNAQIKKVTLFRICRTFHGLKALSYVN